MQITKKQLSTIEYALQLAEYFCDEHESGSDQIKSKIKTIGKLTMMRLKRLNK